MKSLAKCKRAVHKQWHEKRCRREHVRVKFKVLLLKFRSVAFRAISTIEIGLLLLRSGGKSFCFREVMQRLVTTRSQRTQLVPETCCSKCVKMGICYDLISHNSAWAYYLHCNLWCGGTSPMTYLDRASSHVEAPQRAPSDTKKTHE